MMEYVKYIYHLVNVAVQGLEHAKLFTKSGLVNQVSEVVIMVRFRSTVLRDVKKLLCKAGTQVPNYQAAHPARYN